MFRTPYEAGQVGMVLLILRSALVFDHVSETFKQCCGSGSGIRCLFDPWIRDPGSQTHIFESLMTIFCVKGSIIL
jgi:hypothetical protein